MVNSTFFLSLAMAVAAGLVGCFVVMRRMALAADALSHVALPGIGIALALNLNPVFGAAAMLFFGALLVWALENRARASTETAIGVIFSTALAVGSLMTRGEELLEALFGGVGVVGWPELFFSIVVAATVIAFILSQKNRLVVMLVSPDVARTAGIRVKWLNFLYLQMFSLTIALGLRYLGVLLMGALIIIPAATAKRLARDLNSMLLISVIVAVSATILGSWTAGHLNKEPGPLIVTFASAQFFLSLLMRRES